MAFLNPEIDGVYSMGQGKDGRLGLGPDDDKDRKTPCRICGLDGLFEIMKSSVLAS